MSTTHDERPSGRHPVNIGHLVMGLALLGIVGIWALVQSDTVTGDDIRWLLPIPWVVAGAVGLTVTAVTGSRRYAVRQVGWVGDEPPETDTPDPSTDLSTDLSTNLATDPSSNRSTEPSTDEETS